MIKMVVLHAFLGKRINLLLNYFRVTSPARVIGIGSN
jgi:hypothetical protein